LLFYTSKFQFENHFYLICRSVLFTNAHFVFVDLVTNLGPTQTIGIVVKVVLICPKIAPYLEKRFSILFNHYEASPRDVVQWLIDCLENLNVAFSINLGSADLSFIR
ncbi:MAG: hypothetical protein NZ772_13230, partial [Cyanobacteria bacterium]|nr:hypothetical protein [Cyanobacteriota bacterium]MDW8202357.1 hypothetical protein [Cyanobacteriota bacterium SKYGB_h_bin112]